MFPGIWVPWSPKVKPQACFPENSRHPDFMLEFTHSALLFYALVARYPFLTAILHSRSAQLALPFFCLACGRAKGPCDHGGQDFSNGCARSVTRSTSSICRSSCLSTPSSLTQ